MIRKGKKAGFSLIEMLAVVAIIGIISAVAIPSFLGQRRRARVIGDAQATTQVLRMNLETLKADTGIYGAAGTYNWTAAAGADTAAAALLPAYSPTGTGTNTGSKMNYSLVIAAGGLTYQITVTDPQMSNANVYITDQNGNNIFVMH